MNKATLCKYRLQDGELIEKDITNTLCLDDILPLYAMLYKDSSTIAFQDKKLEIYYIKRELQLLFKKKTRGVYHRQQIVPSRLLNNTLDK